MMAGFAQGFACFGKCIAVQEIIHGGMVLEIKREYVFDARSNYRVHGFFAGVDQGAVATRKICVSTAWGRILPPTCSARHSPSCGPTPAAIAAPPRLLGTTRHSHPQKLLSFMTVFGLLRNRPIDLICFGQPVQPEVQHLLVDAPTISETGIFRALFTPHRRCALKRDSDPQCIDVGCDPASAFRSASAF